MIRIENLVKDYGSFRAVSNINFEVQEGEILGFLGPNGAGKSTTMKVITTYLSPTEGNVFINDLNVLDDSMAVRELIGYLPETNPLYEDMNVYEYLQFVATARRVPRDKFKKRVAEVVDICGLKGMVHRMINELSKAIAKGSAWLRPFSTIQDSDPG